jgi:hypothetical protein
MKQNVHDWTVETLNVETIADGGADRVLRLVFPKAEPPPTFFVFIVSKYK